MEGWIAQLTPEQRSPLHGDVTRDGCVNDQDLMQVLFTFGQTGSQLPADLDHNGVVEDADLLEVLMNFGSGC